MGTMMVGSIVPWPAYGALSLIFFGWPPVWGRSSTEMAKVVDPPFGLAMTPAPMPPNWVAPGPTASIFQIFEKKNLEPAPRFRGLSKFS